MRSGAIARSVSQEPVSARKEPLASYDFWAAKC